MHSTFTEQMGGREALQTTTQVATHTEAPFSVSTPPTALCKALSEADSWSRVSRLSESFLVLFMVISSWIVAVEGARPASAGSRRLQVRTPARVAEITQRMPNSWAGYRARRHAPIRARHTATPRRRRSGQGARPEAVGGADG